MSKPLNFVGGVPAGRGHRDMLSAEEWRSIADTLRLSGREFQIVRCIFDGETESIIAQELGISPHTVHTHVERLYRKLNVCNRAELVIHIFDAYISLKNGGSPGALSAGADD